MVAVSEPASTWCTAAALQRVAGRGGWLVSSSEETETALRALHASAKYWCVDPIVSFETHCTRRHGVGQDSYLFERERMGGREGLEAI
jgi:hypothetical protein